MGSAEGGGEGGRGGGRKEGMRSSVGRMRNEGGESEIKLWGCEWYV